MTVQEISDELTLLSHQGKAQAAVMHVSGKVVKNVTGIELIGDDIALIISEKIDPELKDKLLDLKANFDLAIEGRDLKIIKLEQEKKLLGERCNQLLKDKGDLTDKITELNMKIDGLEEQNSYMFNEIALQEQQIEKMRCCENCQTVRDAEGNCYLEKDGKCINLSKWELKENG